MTTITILPEKEDSYRALAGDKESTGRTAGEALDALTLQLPDDESGTLVIVQNYKADEFFTVAQRERLAELMQLRQSRPLSSAEEGELENLIEAELDGARLRTARAVGQQHGEVIPGDLDERKNELKETIDSLNQAAARLRKKRGGRAAKNSSQESKRKTG